MIPDKIYIPLYPNLDTDGFHLGDDWMEKPDSYSKCEHVEYIRKDALLEWLEQELAQRRQWFERYEDAEDLHACNELTKIINKLSEEVHVQDTVDNVVPVGNAMCRL